MRRHLVVFLLAAGLCAPAQPAEPAHPKERKNLQPFELVRSLQLLQDTVAVRGNESLMEYRLALDVIAKAFPAIEPAVWREPKNINAAAQYLLLGGNPKFVEVLVSKGAFATEGTELLGGTLSYVTKRGAARGERFAALNPLDFNPLLGANIAYVQGLLMVNVSPKTAAQEFAKARLWAPGTLIEEAALRAELEISITTGEQDRFAILSRQYFQRFPNSALLPRIASRASVFLISGANMSEGDRSRLVQAWYSRMNGERAELLRLEIASQAVLKGHFQLASGLALNSKQCSGCPRHYLARADLYLLASSLTALGGGGAIGTLEAIDPKSLSPQDLELRNSAIAVARLIWRPIEPFESDFELRTMLKVMPVPVPHDSREEKVRDLVSEARREIAYVESLLEGMSK